jgi:hypothetical protein
MEIDRLSYITRRRKTMETGMVQVDAKQWERLLKMEAKAKLSARRATAKNLIYVEKAKAADITVSKAEVDKWIAADDAKKASEAAPAAEA